MGPSGSLGRAARLRFPEGRKASGAPRVGGDAEPFRAFRSRSRCPKDRLHQVSARDEGRQGPSRDITGTWRSRPFITPSSWYRPNESGRFQPIVTPTDDTPCPPFSDSSRIRGEQQAGTGDAGIGEEICPSSITVNRCSSLSIAGLILHFAEAKGRINGPFRTSPAGSRIH